MYACARGVFAFLVVAVVTGVAAHAQQGPPPPPDSQAQKTSTPSASLVFERHHLRVRLEADGRSTRELVLRVRVNDDIGVRHAGQLPFNYAASTEDLAISNLEVRKQDGRVIAVGADAVRDHAIQPFAGATMFFDLRQKMITVPSLQPGDTVSVTAVWTIDRPLVANHAWFEHSFTKHLTVEDERLEIDVPASSSAAVRIAPTAPREQHGGSGEPAGTRRIYRWQSSNKPSTEDDEANPPEETPPPDVRVTTFSDWGALAAWFRPLLHPTPAPDVRAKALELTKGLTDRTARVQALYE